MTKQQLIKLLAQTGGVTQQIARMVINSMFKSITEALAQGDRVEVRGFGSFVVRHYDGYKGKNPGTGEPVEVRPKKLPFFKVGKELKKRVNPGNG